MNPWPNAALGELCDIVIGRTPDRSRPDFWGEGFPWLSIADMSQGVVIRHTKEQITEEAVRSAKPRIVQPGTVLLSFKLSIGKVGVASVPLYTNEAIAALPIKAGVGLDAQYLVWALRTADLSAGGDRAAMGRTLNKAKLLSVPIPLPPLGEQERIAGILDAADALRVKRQASIAALDTLAQSIFLDMFGDPIANPMRWPLSKLGSAVERVQIGPFGSLLHRSDYVTGGTPLINPSHIIDGEIVPDPDLTVGQQKAMALHTYALSPGDVVMARRGEMGRCAIVTDVEDGYLCGTGSLFIRTSPYALSARYLEGVLSQPSMKARIEERALGITMKNLNQGIVEQLPIPVPPIETQNDFAEAIARLGAPTANTEASMAHLDVLFAALQSRAFRGEL